MKESDWKQFKIVKEKALQRFCERVIVDCREALTEDSADYHSTYTYLYRLLENADKRLALIFDGQSRSQAAIQLSLIRRETLVDDSELEGFSDEFLEATKP